MAEARGPAIGTKGESPERITRETAWLRQIAEGGPQGLQALRQLIDAYRPKVLTFCIRRGMSRADAEDLLQNLWVRVFDRAADFDARGKPSTWIWTIARHLLIDEVRRPYRRLEDALGDDLERTVDEQDGAEASNCVLPGDTIDDCVHRGLQNFARIHDEGAMAVQLRDLEGWDIADLARFLERTEGATRTFLSQVRKKLAPFLKPCFELLSS